MFRKAILGLAAVAALMVGTAGTASARPYYRPVYRGGYYGRPVVRPYVAPVYGGYYRARPYYGGYYNNGYYNNGYYNNNGFYGPGVGVSTPGFGFYLR